MSSWTSPLAPGGNDGRANRPVRAVLRQPHPHRKRNRAQLLSCHDISHPDLPHLSPCIHLQTYVIYSHLFTQSHPESLQSPMRFMVDDAVNTISRNTWYARIHPAQSLDCPRQAANQLATQMRNPSPTISAEMSSKRTPPICKYLRPFVIIAGNGEGRCGNANASSIGGWIGSCTLHQR